MRIKRTSKAFLLALVVVALAAPAVAVAEPVQQFSFQLQDIQSGGRFTLIFSAHTFDTTGVVPPNPVDNYLRLPVGATLRKEFLSKRFYCDGPALRDAINLDFAHSNIPFTKRVADLRPFIRQLAKSRSRRDRRALANAQACERGRVGFGTAKIDARATRGLEVLDRLVPASFSIFFSRPTVKGAIAGFTVLAAADEDSPITKKYPIVAAVHTALPANFINDPTPDGVYGYRLQLPRPDVAGLIVSIAELRVTTTGLSLLRGECLKTGRGGRCVKRQRRTLFWFTTPPCPPSGEFTFLDFFDYADPLTDITKTFSLACPKFLP